MPRGADARLRGNRIGSGVFNLRLEVSGIQLGQQLPAFYNRVEIRVKFYDLPRYLTSNHDRNYGLDGPGGIYHCTQGSGLSNCSEVWIA